MAWTPESKEALRLSVELIKATKGDHGVIVTLEEVYKTVIALMQNQKVPK